MDRGNAAGGFEIFCGQSIRNDFVLIYTNDLLLTDEVANLLPSRTALEPVFPLPPASSYTGNGFDLNKVKATFQNLTQRPQSAYRHVSVHFVI
jgi:hypothetical protein